MDGVKCVFGQMRIHELRWRADRHFDALSPQTSLLLVRAGNPN